jgi:predicted DNA-binding transcriptional regulator YafY
MDELEDKFELTRRTLFRDIRALIDGGIPIGGDAGQGYFIVEGYHLPPVVFDKKEAAAILLGAKFMEKQADSATSDSFQQALTKVKAVLRYADKEFVDQLESRISIVSLHRAHKNEFPDSHLGEIQHALATSRTLQFDYYSSYNDSHTKREVEPLGLVFYSDRWHLIAYCLLRKDLRDFRADRITKIEITSNSFDPANHPDYRNFINRTMLGTDALEVIIQVDKKAARFIENQRYQYGFAEQKDLGDQLEMRFFTPSYYYLGRWLLSLTKSATVISPQEMKDVMAQLIKELNELSY